MTERSEVEHASWKILRDLGMSSEVADEALRLLSRFRSAEESIIQEGEPS